MADIEEQVRAARNPQEAMLILARGIDAVLEALVNQPVMIDDGWGAWSEAPSTGAHTEITGDAEHTEVVVPATSAEKMEQRRHFEEHTLKLAEYFPDEDGTDWNEAYAKGGPRWLYYGNRELVMSYPDQVRAAMVEDVLEDSPQEAEEIGRDLLKFSGETGPGHVAMKMAEGDVG